MLYAIELSPLNWVLVPMPDGSLSFQQSYSQAFYRDGRYFRIVAQVSYTSYFSIVDAWEEVLHNNEVWYYHQSVNVSYISLIFSGNLVYLGGSSL